MMPLIGGESNHRTSIKIHTTVMHVIRVLLWVQATGFEPDLSQFSIDAVNPSDHPWPMGHLLFNFPGERVVKVKMIPAITLGHPQNLLGRIEKSTMKLVGIINESRTCFFDQRPDRAILNRNGQEPEHLMPSLIVEEGKAIA